MKAFDRYLERRQTEWRRDHVETEEEGKWSGHPYPWILPKDSWEENLWSGVRHGSNDSLPAYLEESRVQRHVCANNLKSSWVLCANLYFPFRFTAAGRDLLASFLREYVDPGIESLEQLELEYAECGDLHPSRLLGEEGGGRGANQTSPDLGILVNSGKGIVLIENKLTEHGFYQCSAWKHEGSRSRPGNPHPGRCDHPAEVSLDPSNQCHQSTWGRRYWEHLAPVVNRDILAHLPRCPAAQHGYQLFRQQALAEGIASSGKYDLVVSAVAVDERNEALDSALQRCGINGVREWGSIFDGKARFAVFTHQQWVAWVREQDADENWSDWLLYVQDRYGL